MRNKRPRLADRRRVMGLSQEGLAEAVRVDRTTIARWERGETTPQPWHRPRLAEALKLSVEEVDALLADPDDGPGAPVEPGLSAGLLATAGGIGRTEQVLGSDVYASALQSFRAADRQVGGGHLYATVVSYLHQDVAPDLFRALSTKDGSAVFTAAAALAEMAGWMAHDAGWDGTAYEHFVRSYDLAQAGGDRQLNAHVLASMSHLAHHRAQPKKAIDLARRGREGLSTGPRLPELQARLLALEGRGLAALGQSRACVKMLDRAEAALTSSPDEMPSPWVSRFDQAALANETARSLCYLGDLNAAGSEAERVVTLRTPDRIRSRAFGQLLLVTVLVTQGRLDEACALAAEVLVATRHLGSYLVVRELIELRRRLAPHHASAAASEFLDSLDEALRERCWLLRRDGHEQMATPVGRQ